MVTSFLFYNAWGIRQFIGKLTKCELEKSVTHMLLFV